MPSVYMFTELMLWLMNYLSLLNDEKKKSTAKPSRQRHSYETADYLNLRLFLSLKLKS